MVTIRTWQANFVGDRAGLPRHANRHASTLVSCASPARQRTTLTAIRAPQFLLPSALNCARNAQRFFASSADLIPANTIFVPGIFAFGSLM